MGGRFSKCVYRLIAISASVSALVAETKSAVGSVNDMIGHADERLQSLLTKRATTADPYRLEKDIAYWRSEKKQLRAQLHSKEQYLQSLLLLQQGLRFGTLLYWICYRIVECFRIISALLFYAFCTVIIVILILSHISTMRF